MSPDIIIPSKVVVFGATPFSYGGGYENFARNLRDNITVRGMACDLVELPRWMLSAVGKALYRDSRFKSVSNDPLAVRNWQRRLNAAAIIYCKAEVLDLLVLKMFVRHRRIVAGIHTPLRYPSSHTSVLRRIAYSSRSLSALLDGITVHALLESQRTLLSSSDENSFVIANGVSHPGVSRVGRHGGVAQLRAIFVGRLTEQKGVERLKNVVSCASIASLTICGDGPLKSEVDRLVRVGHGKVRSLGWCNAQQVAEEMAAADILVLPSRWESMPLTVLQAARVGLPVICSPLPELIELKRSLPLSIRFADFDNPCDFADAANRVLVEHPDPIRISQEGAAFDASDAMDRLSSKIIQLAHKVN